MSLSKSLIVISVMAVGMAMATGSERSSSGTVAGTASGIAAASNPETSIQASATPADQGAYFAPFMRFDPDAGNLEVTFGIDQAERVSLQAFDTQGKLLAILLDVNEVPGFHHLSLFSNRLQGYQGKVVFQLRAGNAMLAESRLSAR